MTEFRRLAAAVVLYCVAFLAHAECHFPDGQTAPDNWTMALRSLEAEGCIGISNEDKAPTARRARELIAAADKSGDHAPLLDAVDGLTRFAAAHVGAGQPNDAAWRALHGALEDSTRILTAKPGAARLQPAWRALSANPGVPVPVDGTPVQTVVQIDCGGPSCPAFDDRLDMLRLIRLMASVDAVLQRPGFNEMAREAALRDKRWDAYRTDSLHQYWWELAVNSRRMTASTCPEAVDIDGVKRRFGFCDVPASQVILLHPDAGLVWTRGARSKTDLKGAFLIELLGFYRWNWDSGTAEMRNRMGMSLAAIYADRADGGRWGFGPMVHAGDFNLGVTKARATPWALTVNVELAGKVFDAKPKYLDQLKKAARAMGGTSDAN
jgi:hypothetical protein